MRLEMQNVKPAGNEHTLHFGDLGTVTNLSGRERDNGYPLEILWDSRGTRSHPVYSKLEIVK